MTKPHALVVGASIAGPMTAYWLAKAGWTVTVIERFPGLRPGGQNIDIRTSGVTIMRKIPGMETLVRAKTTTQSALSFVNAQGKPYATMKPTGDPTQQNLLSEYEIFRDDLSAILYELTVRNPNITYVFGEQVAAMQQHSSDSPDSEDGDEKGKGKGKGSSTGITVHFQEGKLPPTTYDLVIACDGATSRTRALALNTPVRTNMRPLNMWAAYATLPTDYLAGSTTGTMYTAPGGRALGIGPDPAGGCRACLLAVLPRPSSPSSSTAMQPFRAAQKAGDTALRTHIAQYFSGTGWTTSPVIHDLVSSPTFYASELSQIHLPPGTLSGTSLHTPFTPFTLVGDAAYASGPTGTGTTLALTGAYILAGSLLQHAHSTAAGLAAYEARMAPLVADMQRVPPGVPGMIAPQTVWGVWVRDAVLVALTWGNAAFGWILKYFAAGFGGDKYEIPEYEWVE